MLAVMPLPFAMPRLVQDLFDELTAEGFAPELELTSTSDIRIWITEGRVVASGTFRRRKNGYDMVHGVLTIDGLVCPTANTAKKLRRICDDPDNHLKTKAGTTVQEVAVKKAADARQMEVPRRGEKVTDESGIPVPVLNLLREITKAGPALSVGGISLEKISRKRWHIWADFSDGGALVVVIVMTIKLPKTGFVIVNRDGLAFDIGDTFNAMFEFMQARKAEEQPNMPTPAHGAPRGSNDQLVVKKNTVIRN